jgi:Ser/Thr protein kinase RdoA (MazF antagonist)
MIDFRERINYDGDISDVLVHVVDCYGIGELKEYSIVEFGFEDLNIQLKTSENTVLVKIYSKNRTVSEIERNADILRAVKDSDVRHPTIYVDADGNILHTDQTSGLKMVVIAFVEGNTFYQLRAVPNNEQLKAVVEQAFKINSIDYEPEYVFDSWAIPNFKQAYDKNYVHIDEDKRYLIDKVYEKFTAIPFDELPKAFVHGDLIKPNLILDHQGDIYVVDFSVANTYPRIQELAVIAQSLLASPSEPALRDRVKKVKQMYEIYAGELNDQENTYLLDYALVGAAMEYLGSVGDRMDSDVSAEGEHYEQLALQTLQSELM